MHTIHSDMKTNQAAPQTRGRTIGWAQHYDSFVKLMLLGQDKTLRETTANMAHIQPGNSVLDVGCGTGDLAIAAKARAGAAGKVYGIDAGPEMIDVARSKVARAGIDIDFRVDLIEALSFEDESFDVVLSSLMMHHLPDDLKRKGLREIARVLKPGGRFFVVDMKRPTARQGWAMLALLGHGKLKSGSQDLAALMQEAGFSQVETGGIFSPVLGFARGTVN